MSLTVLDDEKARLQAFVQTLPGQRRASDMVYFILAPICGRVKIGIACDPWTRLASMQTGSPEALQLLGAVRSDDARRLERALHDAFDGLRSHGEWFEADPELLSFIQSETRDSWAAVCEMRPAPADAPVDRVRPALPAGTIIPKGRGAKLARYKLARGLS